jgi:hypothetical protein
LECLIYFDVLHAIGSIQKSVNNIDLFPFVIHLKIGGAGIEEERKEQKKSKQVTFAHFLLKFANMYYFAH